MKASRSSGATRAPQPLILSTSFVQAARLSRCWMMIPASWHSKHAVRAFACSGPEGRSGICAQTASVTATRNDARRRSRFDMDVHLVEPIPEIAAGVPDTLRGLHTPLAVGGARHERVFPRPSRLPRVREGAARVLGVIL